MADAHSLQFCLLMGLTVVLSFFSAELANHEQHWFAIYDGLFSCFLTCLLFVYACPKNVHTGTSFNGVSSINRLNTRGTQAQLLWAKPLVSGCYHSCIVHFIPIVGVGNEKRILIGPLCKLEAPNH